MTQRRRYTRKDKVSAVTAAAASSVLAAAEASGIPATTIDYWMHQPEFVELRDKTREELGDEYKVLAHMAAARLKELVPTMEPRDLIVLASMTVDKSQLLAGQATARTESRTITEGWEDHERKALRDAINDELAKREVEA